jgi:RNA polymerase sigma-70 factor (ECF subfamily)
VRDLFDFLDTCGPYLLRLLYRVTLREDVAEDLLQELFLKLQASDRFRSAANRAAYARGAALHLAFDWRRDQRRRPITAPPTDESVASDPSPLQRLIADEEIQCVLDLMAELPMSSAELLTMRYLQQDSYETIAQQLGKTAHQARALCHKALSQLRDLAKEKQGVDLERGLP